MRPVMQPTTPAHIWTQCLQQMLREQKRPQRGLAIPAVSCLLSRFNLLPLQVWDASAEQVTDCLGFGIISMSLLRSPTAQQICQCGCRVNHGSNVVRVRGSCIPVGFTNCELGMPVLQTQRLAGARIRGDHFNAWPATE